MPTSRVPVGLEGMFEVHAAYQLLHPPNYDSSENCRYIEAYILDMVSRAFPWFGSLLGLMCERTSNPNPESLDVKYWIGQTFPRLMKARQGFEGREDLLLQVFKGHAMLNLLSLLYDDIGVL